MFICSLCFQTGKSLHLVCAELSFAIVFLLDMATNYHVSDYDLFYQHNVNSY